MKPKTIAVAILVVVLILIGATWGKARGEAVSQKDIVPVTFLWDPNSESDLAGYRLYASDAQSNTVRAEVTNTQVTVNLPIDREWTVHVTAFNAAGLESGPSVPVRVPPRPKAPVGVKYVITVTTTTVVQ